MAGYHIGLEIFAERLGEYHTMQEDRGLGHFRLTEILFSAVKHEISDAETEHFIGLLEELAGFGVVVVEIFAHADKLRTLTGEYICFHIQIKISRCKINKNENNRQI